MPSPGEGEKKNLSSLSVCFHLPEAFHMALDQSRWTCKDLLTLLHAVQSCFPPLSLSSETVWKDLRAAYLKHMLLVSLWFSNCSAGGRSRMALLYT